jgi:thiol-disulfide isomerase/thioredoxin
MMKLSSTTTAIRMFLCRGAALAMCLALTLAAGCQQEPSPEKKAATEKKATSEKKATAPAEPVAKPKETNAETGAKTPTGREVLERMVAAYHKASSYSDAGTVHLVAEAGDKKTHDVKANFSLALVRPNKLRIEAYHVSLVCDGRKMYATLNNLPGQVLVRPAPETLNLKALDVDLILAHSLIQDFAGMMPQIMLLFADKALDDLLHDAEEPELAQSVAIEGHDCYRVKIKFPGDMATFWIDRETYALRRLVMPTNGMRQNLSQQEPVDNLSIVADFASAQLNTKVDPKAFEFEMPREAEAVPFFVPPGIKTALAVLNKPAPATKFAGLDGKPLAPESLAGKVVVLDFWASWCQPCRESLPELEKTREKFKDNPKVAFYAVSVDRPEVENKDLVKLFEDMKVNIPILRDPEDSAAAFHFRPIPATFIIDEKGVVQDFQEGYNPQDDGEMTAKLDKLLAGGNIVEGSLKRYQDQIEELRQYAEKPEKSTDEPKDAAAGEPPAAGEERVALPEVATAPPSKPATFKLLPLWKCDALKSPGNILVVGGKNEPNRLLVVENWNSVAEVSLDGKLIALHNVDLDEKAEFICSLRAFTTRDGKRYVAAFATGRQRFHLFDSNWKQILTYPEDALTSPHSGIADVQLADLDGEGVPKIYVGYFGAVGVQAVSLEGKRLWANRTVANVTHLAVGQADEKGRGTLLCATVSGLPVIVDAEGQTRGEVGIPVQGMSSILSADLRGDGELLWCGITASQTQKNVALGFSLKGPLVWEYALPNGVQPRPIEPIIVGQIKGEGPSQWILPGADGSIHIVAPDGRLMDRFDYGTVLQGLATVQIDGQPAMIVSSVKGLEAWKGR